MRVYLAGPMSNIPQFNFPAFFAAAEKLFNDGHDVFNPAQKARERAGDGWWEKSDGSHVNLPTNISYRECLRVDLNWILDHAEAIALLPGWENSKGVKAELALASALGLRVIYL